MRRLPLCRCSQRSWVCFAALPRFFLFVAQRHCQCRRISLPSSCSSVSVPLALFLKAYSINRPLPWMQSHGRRHTSSGMRLVRQRHAGQLAWTSSVRHHNQVYDWASIPIRLDSLRLDAMEKQRRNSKMLFGAKNSVV